MTHAHRPPGRPAGPSDTRERVLASAAECFVRAGYRRTTLRGIAAEVGVDVTTVVHHGGPKHVLFARSMMLAVGPAQVMRAMLGAPADQMAITLVNVIGQVWADESRRRPLERLLATALTDERVREVCREYIEMEMVRPLADHLPGPDAQTRALSALCVVLGVVTTRYMLGVEPGVRGIEPLRALAPHLHALFVGHRPGP